MGNKLFKPYEKIKSQMEVVSKSNTRVPLWLKQHIHTKLKQYDGFSSTHCICAFLYLLYGKQKKKLELQLQFHCGPGSSVGIATGYRLDGPGIESR
jgi:hypothetical protein